MGIKRNLIGILAALAMHSSGENELKISYFGRDEHYTDSWRITATNTIPGKFYWIQKAPTMQGPWQDEVGDQQAKTNYVNFVVSNDGTNKFYRVSGED